MAGRPHAGADYPNRDYDIALRDICARAEAPARDDMRLSHPGEPIHVPRRRGSSFWQALIVSLLLCAGGWGLFSTQEFWRPYASELASATMAALERASAGQVNPSTPPVASASEAAMPSPAEPMTSRDVVDAPGIATGTPVAGAVGPEVTGASAPAAGADIARSVEDTGQGGETPAEVKPADEAATGGAGAVQADVTPLPPPKVDPGDPYQKRALAVGLHPELSRVLLSRLTDADYRNAGIAIGKAVAEVGDGGKLVWPKQRQPKHALFQVHFVAGASPDCRRYVVVVTKDGWSTTAQPMERCGVKRVPRQSS